MPKQPRARRVDQSGQIAALQQLDTRSNEELAAETRYKAAAQAILGRRAAEKYDADKARAHFQRAIAAARPQERLQIRRMADAALALAERRPDDLKRATERLGVEGPTSRQMLGLRIMSVVVPPSSAGGLARVRGILILLLVIVAILAAAFGSVSGVSAAAGGLSLSLRIFYSIVLIVVLIVVLVVLGRRRQRRAQAMRAERTATGSR